MEGVRNMGQTTRRLGWSLESAGLAALLGISGCSMLDPRSYSSIPPSAHPDPMPIPAAEAPVAGAPVAMPASVEPLFEKPQSIAESPEAVNIFGEFGNKPNPAPRFATGGFDQVTFVDEGYDTDVQVSPDGQWLVFASTRHNEKPEIYLQRVGGLSVTQLTCDDADDASPTFSPDGKRIAFASTRNGNWDIYLMDVDGRNVTQITNSAMQELHPSFSPCGTRLVYSAIGTRSGQWELWTASVNGGERRMIGYGLFPVWSPRTDRDQIAFQRARQRGSRWFSLWTLDLVDGEARNVTEIAASANAAIVSPAWNADGTKLAFSTIVNPSQTAPARNAGQQDVWVVNADGTGRRRITDGNGVNATPTWSRDGRIFFVSNRGGCDAVWSAHADRVPTQNAAVSDGKDPFANTGRD